MTPSLVVPMPLTIGPIGRERELTAVMYSS
jgi:hypothetical protein